MHDYFDIVGVSRGARAPEIRRACRRSRPTHPDIGDAEGAAVSECVRPAAVSAADLGGAGDAAVDFVEVAPIVERMRAAFFGTGR